MDKYEYKYKRDKLELIFFIALFALCLGGCMTCNHYNTIEPTQKIENNG